MLTENEITRLDKIGDAVQGDQCPGCFAGTTEDGDECQNCDGMGWLPTYDYTDTFKTSEDLEWLVKRVRTLNGHLGNYESMQQTNQVLVKRLQAVASVVAERKALAQADAVACDDQDSEQFAVAAARSMEASIIELALEAIKPTSPKEEKGAPQND